MRSLWIGLLAIVSFATVRSAERAPSDLIRALGGEDAVARLEAEETLVAMGDAAIPGLERLATSPGYTVERQYAFNILAAIRTQKAIAVLLHVLEQEQDVMPRGALCQHLGRLGVEEAVPIIGKWLLTIQGQPVDIGGGDRYGNPMVVTRSYAWVRHVHALRNIGGEQATPILEKMLAKPNTGKGGERINRACRTDLAELKREAGFWQAVRRVPGLEAEAKRLFAFFRTDTLALIRLYHDKLIERGTEGRWVLESLERHPDGAVARAAKAMLAHYGKLKE
ncbi:MAG: hypothetical protein FJ290_14055 [Planctomycetes bacterium]|nr:hypothetical protein [Planctomycetota bacterium]